jgi:hypothetical protein
MPDTKGSALNTNTGATLAATDRFVIVDIGGTETKTIAADETAIGLPITDTNSIITATALNAALQEAFQGAFSVNVVATSGAAETLTVQPAHKVTMDQNCELTFMTPPTVGFSFLLHLLGAFTPTFPGSVDWDAGAAPTYADDSVYGFWTDDTGTTWYGSLIASALA